MSTEVTRLGLCALQEGLRAKAKSRLSGEDIRRTSARRWRPTLEDATTASACPYVISATAPKAHIILAPCVSECVQELDAARTLASYLRCLGSAVCSVLHAIQLYDTTDAQRQHSTALPYSRTGPWSSRSSPHEPNARTSWLEVRAVILWIPHQERWHGTVALDLGSFAALDPPTPPRCRWLWSCGRFYPAAVPTFVEVTAARLACGVAGATARACASAHLLMDHDGGTHEAIIRYDTTA